jgi:hypothetical protein
MVQRVQLPTVQRPFFDIPMFPAMRIQITTEQLNDPQRPIGRFPSSCAYLN